MFARAGFSPRTLGTWDLEIDFEDWVARMHTPPDRVAALRELADRADPAVRGHFEFTGRPGTFLIPIALLRG